MTIRKMTLLAATLLLLIPTFASAQLRTRNQLDREVDKHFNKKKLPGLTVMYAENGRTTYTRFRGHANMEKGHRIKDYHIMRHASVSKLIASVLAIKLEEKGKLDLKKKVRFYIPEMPEHHNYRVIDLLTCRSGVRHYGGTQSPLSPDDFGDKKYETSYEAMKNFWHDPLENKFRAYHYSTHGYTIAAAVMEKVTGKSISKIIKDELSNPYQLYSLAAEDKSTYKSARVKLYEFDENQADRNKPVSRDHISWKVLGGGIESSSKDLLRFLVLLGDGKIIKKRNVDRLMKRIDNGHPYAVGCLHTIENGYHVLGKDGANRGANTYVWLSPKTRQAMVVMINRKQSADAPTLGRKLRDIVMDGNNTNQPDLIVSRFERTGKVYYQDGKIKIPVRMRIKNQGRGSTYQVPDSNFIQEKFVNAIRVGQKYCFSTMQNTMAAGAETGWIKTTISISDPNRLRAGQTIKLEARADAPIAAGDTSMNQQSARIKESNESNNSRFLLVKVPGSNIGGLKGEQTNQDRVPSQRPNRVPTTRPNRLPVSRPNRLPTTRPNRVPTKRPGRPTTNKKPVKKESKTESKLPNRYPKKRPGKRFGKRTVK